MCNKRVGSSEKQLWWKIFHTGFATRTTPCKWNFLEHRVIEHETNVSRYVTHRKGEELPILCICVLCVTCYYIEMLSPVQWAWHFPHNGAFHNIPLQWTSWWWDFILLRFKRVLGHCLDSKLNSLRCLSTGNETENTARSQGVIILSFPVQT